MLQENTYYLLIEAPWSILIKCVRDNSNYNIICTMSDFELLGKITGKKYVDYTEYEISGFLQLDATCYPILDFNNLNFYIRTPMSRR